MNLDSALQELKTNIENNIDSSSIVILEGKMGVGKTYFVKKFVEFMEIDEVVTSPTFSLMNQYKDIYHYDLYNYLDSISLLINKGIFELLNEKGIHLVEWGDILIPMLKQLETSFITLKITESKNKREYNLTFNHNAKAEQ